MLAYPLIVVCTILTLGGVEAFASSGIVAVARPGGSFSTTARRPPPSSGSGSGSGTCVVSGIARTAQGGEMDARWRLEMKRRRGRDRTTNVGKDDGRSAAATATNSSRRKVTKIDDGSPLGVAIVLLGGAWVVLGDGDGGGGGSSTGDAQMLLPPFFASVASSADGVAGNAG